MHLRAQPVCLLHGLLRDIGCLFLCNLKQLLHAPSNAGEVGMGGASIGLVERMAKLMVVRHQCVVLLQQVSDLRMCRLHEMINGRAVISFSRQGKAAVIGMLVSSRGHIHAGSLMPSAVTPSHLRVTAPAAR